MITVGGTLGEPQRPGLAAEDADQFLVDDLDDLLCRVQRGVDLCALRPLADVADELLDDVEVDVRLEQREPDLAGGGVDVGVGQPGLAPQVAERGGQPVGKGVEQG